MTLPRKKLVQQKQESPTSPLIARSIQPYQKHTQQILRALTLEESEREDAVKAALNDFAVAIVIATRKHDAKCVFPPKEMVTYINWVEDSFHD